MVQGYRILGVEIDHGSGIHSFRGRDRYIMVQGYRVLGVEIDDGSGMQSFRSRDRSWFRDTLF